MQNMNKRLSAFSALLVGGLVLVIASGCAGGNPFIGEAEDNLEAQNYEQALVNVDSALAQNPENAEAHMLRARILEQQAANMEDAQQHAELVAQAIEAQEEAIAIDPSLRSEVQTRRQLQYVQEMQSGAELFQQAQQEQDTEAYQQAASYFQAAHTIFPDSASAYLNEAYALINAGDQPASIEPLEGYVQRSDSVGADQYMLLSQLYLTNNRADDAIPVLEEAADQYPDNADIQSLLLNAYNAAGETESAIEAYRDQVQREPDNALYRYNLGSLLLNENRYEEAMEHLQRAVEVEPGNTNAQYNLGAAHVNKAVAIDDSIGALEDSLRANQDELSDGQIQEIDAQLQELVEQRRQLFEDAIPPLERARQMTQSGDPNREGICRALFSAYVQTEQEEEAREVEECAGHSDVQQQQPPE